MTDHKQLQKNDLIEGNDIHKFDNLSRDQLISHIRQLESSFHDFSTQSSQVEDLLQQQLENCIKQMDEKDHNIRQMSKQLTHLDAINVKVTTLEVDNDLLESTIRTLTSQLEHEVESHNECIEKIALLENELEWLKSSLKNTSNHTPKNQSPSKVQHSLSNENINANSEELWLKDWHAKEKIWTNKVTHLQTQINELNSSKYELEVQLRNCLHLQHEQKTNQSEKKEVSDERELEKLKAVQDDLVYALEQSEYEKNLLEAKLKALQKKYSKVHTISKMVKLKKKGLAKVYTTPALDPLA